MTISFLDRVQKIVGKGYNAGYQHFVLFDDVFQSLFSWGRSKSGLCGEDLNLTIIKSELLTFTPIKFNSLYGIESNFVIKNY